MKNKKLNSKSIERIKSIIFKGGGDVYEEEDQVIVAEFTCIMGAEICKRKLGRAGFDANRVSTCVYVKLYKRSK